MHFKANRILASIYSAAVLYNDGSNIFIDYEIIKTLSF